MSSMHTDPGRAASERHWTPAPCAAFTLIELLVVIAIIAILASLLLPVLGKTKARSLTIACAGNLKQLQICWQSYTEDNADQLPGNAGLNSGDVGNRQAWTAEPSSWAQDNAWADSNPTNLQRGVLYRYNQALGIYRCPADRSTVRDQGFAQRHRSVSMSMYMNFRPNPADPGYDICWHRLAQVQHPSPSRAAVFIDENEKSIQQSAFGINAPDNLTLFDSTLWTWVSFPATRHNNAGTLSFADGHVEVWRWHEANTLQTSSLNDWIVLKPAAGAGDRDLSRFFKAIPEKVPVQ